MIDVENELFTEVYNEVIKEYPDIYMTGEYELAQSELPCLYFMELDNSVRKATITSSKMENFADVMYEATAYSNKITDKKSECKAILQIVDRVMSRRGLRRTMKQIVPNMLDSTVCRMVARYEGTVSEDKVFYRR